MSRLSWYVCLVPQTVAWRFSCATVHVCARLLLGEEADALQGLPLRRAVQLDDVEQEGDV